METELCPKCNNIIPIGKKYCNICGAKLLEESEDIDVQFESGSEDKGGSIEKVIIPDIGMETQENAEKAECNRRDIAIAISVEIKFYSGKILFKMWESCSYSQLVREQRYCGGANYSMP